jgi:lipid-A-disaccharide synthase
MKLYIIAGEASGDLHGSNLIKALKEIHPGVECRVWGGEMMQDAGGELVKHYRELAFMGFVEVLAHLRTIMGNIRFCKKDIAAFQPDAVILIDYPGFNLRIARWLRASVNAGKMKTKIVYYISPQIWAWHKSRVHAIKRDIDKMLVILPFETAFYQQYQVASTFVGHPLLDVIPATIRTDAAATKKIALLPGSRRQEVKKILPVMLSVTDAFPDYTFTIAASTALPKDYYASFARDYPNVKIVSGDTYQVLRDADAALVKSGTSTLEAALWGTPQVVCYAGNPISFAIAKRIVNIKYISLVNLIADAPVVRELIQDELNRAHLIEALQEILTPEKRKTLQLEYARIRSVLGESGASDNAAKAILDLC